MLDGSLRECRGDTRPAGATAHPREPFQSYAHDFMDFDDLELDSDGRFSHKNLPLDWSDPHRHPFRLRIDGRLAGFVPVK
jgi:hypothetical protein